jgi:hypothetical protein
MKISKSRFVAGCQCLKRLYLQVHEPELAALPNAADEAIIEQGREVGLVARQLFPGGVEVSGSGGLEAAIRTTRELVANPKVPAIFEGTFEDRNVVVRVDVLHRRRDGRWRLVEVKSTTDLKEHHLEDVAIQSRVVTGCDDWGSARNRASLVCNRGKCSTKEHRTHQIDPLSLSRSPHRTFRHISHSSWRQSLLLFLASLLFSNYDSSPACAHGTLGT